MKSVHGTPGLSWLMLADSMHQLNHVISIDYAQPCGVVCVSTMSIATAKVSKLGNSIPSVKHPGELAPSIVVGKQTKNSWIVAGKQLNLSIHQFGRNNKQSKQSTCLD